MVTHMIEVPQMKEGWQKKYLNNGQSFSKLDENYRPIDPRSSMNPEKHREKYITFCDNQIV